MFTISSCKHVYANIYHLFDWCVRLCSRIFHLYDLMAIMNVLGTLMNGSLVIELLSPFASASAENTTPALLLGKCYTRTRRSR